MRHTTPALDYHDRECDSPTFESRPCTDCPETAPPAEVTPVVPTPAPSVTPTTPEGGIPGNADGTSGEAGGDETGREEHRGAPAAAIAGGVVGGLLLLAAAGGGGYYFTHR